MVCHDSVTLCPLAMAVLLAENVSVGELDPGFPIPCDPQPLNVIRAITTVITKQEKRMQRDFISMGPGQILPVWIGILSCTPELLPAINTLALKDVFLIS